jgi:hypothetical protein
VLGRCSAKAEQQLPDGAPHTLLMKISETITANPISGLNPVTINVQTTTDLKLGGTSKWIIEGKVGSQDVSLVERQFDENYVSSWHTFREAGLPVVPTLRKSSKGTLLVTNVRAHGNEVYGKALKHELIAGFYQRPRQAKAIDDVFLRLTDPNCFSALSEKVFSYVKIANKNKIKLPWDDPFELVVRPDGSWDFITLDLHYAVKYDSLAGNPLDWAEAVQYNTSNTNALLNNLRIIRDHIRDDRERFRFPWQTRA